VAAVQVGVEAKKGGHQLRRFLERLDACWLVDPRAAALFVAPATEDPLAQCATLDWRAEDAVLVRKEQLRRHDAMPRQLGDEDLLPRYVSSALFAVELHPHSFRCLAYVAPDERHKLCGAGTPEEADKGDGLGAEQLPLIWRVRPEVEEVLVGERGSAIRDVLLGHSLCCFSREKVGEL